MLINIFFFFFLSNRNEILLNILYAQLICRPNCKYLQNISKCLLKISLINDNSDALLFLNEMCGNCTKSTIQRQEKKIYFTIETCPLQIISFYTQIIFEDINVTQIDVLTNVTLNILQFIRNCFMKAINFFVVRKSSTMSTINTRCLCYANIACTGIFLIYQCLKVWTNDGKLIGRDLIGTIARSGIMFLFDILLLNYDEKIFQIGGSLMRHQLKMITVWINDCWEYFNLSEFHSKSLFKKIFIDFLFYNNIFVHFHS